MGGMKSKCLRNRGIGKAAGVRTQKLCIFLDATATAQMCEVRCVNPGLSARVLHGLLCMLR